jgi:hypothetical protein
LIPNFSNFPILWLFYLFIADEINKYFNFWTAFGGRGYGLPTADGAMDCLRRTGLWTAYGGRGFSKLLITKKFNWDKKGWMGLKFSLNLNFLLKIIFIFIFKKMFHLTMFFSPIHPF